MAIGLLLCAAVAGCAAAAASAARTRQQAHADALYGVSCTSPGSCMAVGYRTAGKAGNYRPLAESWNGRTWRSVLVPGPVTLVRTELTQVSCLSGRSCVAVGYHFGRGGIADLAEQWNGARWRIIQSRSPLGSGGLLNDVNCRNPYGCVAVGDYVTGSGAVHALAELWTASQWRVIEPGTPAGARQTALYGISCSYSYCMAAGNYADAAGRMRTLAYIWTGSAWTLTSPASSGRLDTALYGISCRARAQCMAVGSASSGSRRQPFTASWLDGHWTPVPGGSQADGALNAVACPGAAHCLAVGSAVGQPVIEAWSGARWRELRLAAVRGPSAGVLYRLSCHTQSVRCIAVGAWLARGTNAARATLAEEWNGHSWAIMTTVNP
jgi:hypothetical protein